MALCKICHESLADIGGGGLRLSYVCPSANCPSNGGRRLKCPNPKCKGRALTQESIAKGHLLFYCTSCTFGFDNLGQVAAPKCPICSRRANVFQTITGFLISCPSGDKQPITVEWQRAATMPD